jgi:hypothetical protein
MERALAGLPARDFPEPRQPVAFHTWERGPSALSYDPYYTAPASPTTTDEETTTQKADATPAGANRAATPDAAAAGGARSDEP